MISDVIFDTTTVPVHGGEARIPGRYSHDFASIPQDWRTVQTDSKYVVFPHLPPMSRGYLRIYGGESVGDRLEVWGDPVVYAGAWQRPPRWRVAIDEARHRLTHAIAALRGSYHDCEYD